MTKLRKVGLIIALLPVPFLLIYAVSQGLNEYYGFSDNMLVAFMYGMPCLLITTVSWRWPRRGGIAAILAALLLLVFSTISIMQSKAPDPASQRISLSFTEISTHVLPYALLLIGCILAFVAVWQSRSLDFHPGAGTDTVGRSKLAKTGLLMMLLPGIVVILTLIIAIGIGGDMVLSMNLFSGLLMGMMYGGPPLILAAAAWRWPLRGSVVAIVFSVIAMLLYGLLKLVFAEYPANPFLTTAYFALMTVVLVGGILVFISARRTSQTL